MSQHRLLTYACTSLIVQAIPQNTTPTPTPAPAQTDQPQSTFSIIAIISISLACFLILIVCLACLHHYRHLFNGLSWWKPLTSTSSRTVRDSGISGGNLRNSRAKLRSHTSAQRSGQRSGQSSRQYRTRNAHDSINYPNGLGTHSVEDRRGIPSPRLRPTVNADDVHPEGYSVHLMAAPVQAPPVSHVVGGVVLPVHDAASVASTSLDDKTAKNDWTVMKLLTKWSAKDYAKGHVKERKGSTSLPSWRSADSQKSTKKRSKKQIQSMGNVEDDDVMEVGPAVVDEQEEHAVMAAANAVITLSLEERSPLTEVLPEDGQALRVWKNKAGEEGPNGGLNDGSRTSFQVW